MAAGFCTLSALPKSVKGDKESEVMFAHVGCEEQVSPVFSALGVTVWSLRGVPCHLLHSKYVPRAALGVVGTRAAGMVCSRLGQRFS